MLKADYYQEPSELDLIVFVKLVPEDHILRRVKENIDFSAFRKLLADCYSQAMGRTAEDPVRMVKLEYLQFQYGLSDREVLKQVQVNVAFRYFLDLSLDSGLPTSGLLSQFRLRLGEERHRKLFEEIVSQARQKGLVKDRLRLKDATHVIANIAVPSAIGLVAQTRDRLLKNARRYAVQRVEQEEQEAQHIREWSDDLKDEERLLARIEHLRRIVAWADELQKEQGSVRGKEKQWKRFEEALALAHQILDQCDNPEGGGKIRSAHDPDARRGWHKDFFDGYHLDISLDADSELITAVTTPPANQDEGKNAQKLIEQEERAQGNDIAAISMDGIGFRGDVLRALQDPAGPGVQVFVPPQEWYVYNTPYFTPDKFHLEEGGQLLICPGEEETRSRTRTGNGTGWQFYFKRSQCKDCPLLNQCLEYLPKQRGRTISKNDYDAEYQDARQLALTPAYTQVRREHPRVERKFAEIIQFHGGRRARYRGHWRVAIQYLLIAMVVNIKRMVRLLLSPPDQDMTQVPAG
jgi:transposase